MGIGQCDTILTMPGSLHATRARPDEAAGGGEGQNRNPGVEREVRRWRQPEFLVRRHERGEMDVRKSRYYFDQPWVHSLHVSEEVRLVPPHLKPNVST